MITKCQIKVWSSLWNNFIIAWKFPFSVTTINSPWLNLCKGQIAPNEEELLLWLLLGYKLLHTCRLFCWIVFSLFVNEILLWDSVSSSFLIFTNLLMSGNTSFVNLLCLKNLFSSIIRIKAWRILLLLSAVLFSCFFALIGCFFKSKFLRLFFIMRNLKHCIVEEVC